MYEYSKVQYQSQPYEVDINITSTNGYVGTHCSTYVEEQRQQQHVYIRREPQCEQKLSYVQQAVQDQMDEFLKDKERLSQLFESIKDKKENFKRIVQKAKNDCLQMVTVHFEQLQTRWQQDMITQQRKHSLHSQQNLETLQELLRNEINCLIDLRRVLNNFDYVNHIRKIEEQTLAKCKKFHWRIVSEIEDNEEYTPVIQYNVDLLNQMSRNLKNILVLQFKMPMKKHKVPKEPQVIKERLHNNAYLQRKNSMPNFSQTMKSQNSCSTNFYSTAKSGHSFLDNYDQIIKSRCSQTLKRPSSVSRMQNITVITKEPRYTPAKVIATTYAEVPKPKPKVIVTSYYQNEPRRVLVDNYKDESKVILTDYNDVARMVQSTTSYISPSPSYAYYKEAVNHQPVVIEKLSPEYFKEKTNQDTIIFEKPNSYKLKYTPNYTGSINLAKYSKNELNKQNLKFKKCGYSSLASSYTESDPFAMSRDSRWR